MRRLLPAILILLFLLPVSAQSQSDLDYWQLLALDRSSFRFRGMAMLPAGVGGEQVMVYGDRFGILRAIEMRSEGVDEIWRSRNLEGAILEILVEDLDGNGGAEILARTQNGRIYVFDESYNLKWESPLEEYGRVTAFTIANMDGDPAYEIVVLADGIIHYIDGAEFNREFNSTQTYFGTEMLVGNVDSDFTLEIVLNTGWVLDAQAAEVEWQSELFGQQIELLDIDGDGMQEIIGVTPLQPIRIFDADKQEEKPLQ